MRFRISGSTVPSYYICNMNWTKRLFLFLLPTAIIFSACSTADLYEKSVTIPAHAWKSSYRPEFPFTIKDTSASYELFLVLRHSDRYHFNNIYIDLSVKTPGADSAKIIRCDLRLANDINGWLGSGMDDIFEHRISLNRQLVENSISLRQPGDYLFSVAQVMREDPLEQVYNVGLRIEKK